MTGITVPRALSPCYPGYMATRDELDALTGLRGIAALWVLAYHAGLSAAGYLGVDLFFVLSGFIIAYNYADARLAEDGRRYREFLWRRLARIYPAYLAALLLTLAAVAVLAPWEVSLRKSAHFTAEGFWASVFMVQAWTVPVPRVWNVPGWSVSAEWAAYLAFPLIAAPRSPRRVDAHRDAGDRAAVCAAGAGDEPAVVARDAVLRARADRGGLRRRRTAASTLAAARRAA